MSDESTFYIFLVKISINILKKRYNHQNTVEAVVVFGWIHPVMILSKVMEEWMQENTALESNWLVIASRFGLTVILNLVPVQ